MVTNNYIVGMPSIVTLISGRGSNFEAIVKTAQKENWEVRFSGVIANRPEAKGLDFARSEGIPALVLDHKTYPDRVAFDRALMQQIDLLKPDLVVLAGFMRILTPEFIRHYAGKLINIHPSLLPAFPGLDTHARALAAGVRLHGCTVHLVTAGVDEGPIIAQAAVPVLPNDTEASLAARVLAAEHKLYPAALSWLAAGHVRLEADRVEITGAEYAPDSLLNPLPRAALLSTQ